MGLDRRRNIKLTRQHHPVRGIYHVTITSKGQMTIPAELQRRLGLRRGDPVEIAVVGEDLLFTFPRPRGNRRHLGKLLS